MWARRAKEAGAMAVEKAGEVKLLNPLPARS
jgi:hypothetical protein